MDDQETNRQKSTNQLNLENNDGTTEQLRWPDLHTFDNRLPSMSTIPNATDRPAVCAPNWLPGSSFQFLRPSGVLPYNLYMAPTASPENAMSNFNQSMPFFQAPSQSQNFDAQHSQKSSRKNQTGGAKAKEHWTVDEDVELCAAWLKISEDPIIGNGQRQAKFWTRILDEFHQRMKEKVGKFTLRSKDAATCRWGAIHPAITRWCGLHATLTRNLESGWTVEQMESRVRAMYQAKYKEMFKFEECWKVLRDSYKWKTWKQGKNGGIDEGIHPDRAPPLSQQDKEYVEVDKEYVDLEVPLSPNTGTSRSVRPPGQLGSDKDQNPLFTGPASTDKPRPSKRKDVMNQRQRKKQQFNDQQTLLSDSISAMLMGIEAKAEDRHKRQEELKQRRDDVLDQRFEEQKQLAQKEHRITMENQKTQMMKDLKYVTNELVEAYKELEALKKSSLMTPHERFEYDMKMEWVEMLQAQRASKRRKILLATSPVQSPTAQVSASRVSTSEFTPRRLDDDDWRTGHDI